MHRVQRLDLRDLFPSRRDAYAVVVDGVFTKAECESLIERTNTAGYIPALVGGQQVRKEEQRNNYRCIIDDKEFAEELFTRLRQYIPVEWLTFPVSQVNERMRFLKYHPGEYFKPHNDGIFTRDDGSQASFVTIQLYLNDVPEGNGGETTFTTEQMTYGRHMHKNKKDSEPIKKLSVRPVTGRVLIFEHHLPHEGTLLTSGVKYTLRTDVMYDTHGKGRKQVQQPRWGVPTVSHPQYKLYAGQDSQRK